MNDRNQPSKLDKVNTAFTIATWLLSAFVAVVVCNIRLTIENRSQADRIESDGKYEPKTDHAADFQSLHKEQEEAARQQEKTDLAIQHLTDILVPRRATVTGGRQGEVNKNTTD